MTETATVQRQIKLELSSQQETLKVGQASVFFQATVYNDSDRFASFQLRLLAAGAPTNHPQSWYRLAPSVSSKIPAGDCTHFQIEVFDLPPITEQFRGAIDITIEVTSRELDNQYDLDYLRLVVEGFQGKPPTLTLSSSRQQAKPREQVAIACQVHNPATTPLNVTLRLFGLPDAWFPYGTQQQLFVDPGKPQKVIFNCELPAPSQALSRSYPLRVEVTGQFPTVTAVGEFYILPSGSLSLSCDPLENSIPTLLATGQLATGQAAADTATFTLQFNNQSNSDLPVQIAIVALQPNRGWQSGQDDQPADQTSDPEGLPPGVSLKALPAALPIGASSALVEIQRRRPWLGWTRLQQFQVTAQLPDSAIDLQPNQHTIQLQVFPIVPFWQQVLGILLAMGLGALTYGLLEDSGHRNPVNSLQFNGQGTEVLSGSDDQTLRRWRVLGGKLEPQLHRLGSFDKAVRLIRYRPVNNDQVAVGFENGEIQVINLLTGQRSRLTADKDDRVLALVFSRDARTLYSGHGSGLVLPWDITRPANEIELPQQAYDLGFAIQSMALVTDDDSILAIAGRYNRLELLNLQQTEIQQTEPTPPQGNLGKPFTNQPPSRNPTKLSQLIKVNYPSGGSTDYIASISSAQQKPSLLAVADTKGYISLWDVQACLDKQGRCAAIDRPWLGHEGSPVRAVALSADGCFLASAGDDGRVKLWSLNEQGSRRSSALEGRVLAQFPKPLNAVDVIQRNDRIWVISGGDDRTVRLQSVGIQGRAPSFDVCPLLTGER